jgi:hypothetical protein
MNLFDEWFYYDETSSTCLRWKQDKFVGKNYNVHRIVKDSEAGSRGQRRMSAMLNDKGYSVHHIVLYLHSIEVPKNYVVDHIDGNPFNNKISNLRVVSQAVNARNQKKSKLNTSGSTGVSLHMNSYWKAYWNEGDKQKVKYFSISEHGNKGAKDLAINYRKDQIMKLNENNYGYSDRHGND